MSLAELHGLGSAITLAAIAAFGVAAAVVAVADRFHDALGRLRTLLLVVIGLQVLVGAGTWLSGVRPRDDLHMLYGVVLLAVLPLADNFAEEAPPRARAGVLAVAALVGLALVWRLSSTG
jgi:hypothetical protein